MTTTGAWVLDARVGQQLTHAGVDLVADWAVSPLRPDRAGSVSSQSR
jgi:hypothetical protein